MNGGVIKKMTTKKTSRRALLTSVMALVMCVVMLVGTTFAWFTDSVTSGVNTIKSGNLDVTLQYKNADVADYTDVAEATDLFDKDAKWEPGHVEYVMLQVTNVGSLALKYKLGVNIAKETTSTSVLDSELKLSDYLHFAVLPGEADVTSRTTLLAAAAAADLGTLSTGYTAAEGHLAAGAANSSKIVTLVVWMPTTIGNEANHKTGEKAPTIQLGVSLVATQDTVESDSFDNTYDAQAEYPTTSTGSQLEEIFDGVDFGYGAAAPDGAVTINGGGTTTVTEWTDAWIKADTTIRGVTFANGAVFTAGADNVTLTLENCTFYACDQNLITAAHKVNSGAGMCLNVEKAGKTGVTFVIKNCTFIGENDATLDREGPRYNADGTTNGTKARGHAIALDAICGGGTGTLNALTIEGCTITGVRGNAIQLYGSTGDITISNTKINSWGMNSSLTKDDAAIRGDFPAGGSRTLTLSNNYFGLNENTDAANGKLLYHVNVGSYEGNTAPAGGRTAGTY